MEHLKALAGIAALDAGMHNPARLMIVYLLARNEGMDYLQLLKLTKLSSGNITTHLGKLLECGYIQITKSFRGKKPHTAVQLTPAGKQAYLQWGEFILQALPEETLQKVPGKLSQAELNVLRYHLTLQDCFPDFQERNLPYFLANKENRIIAWPPLEEVWMC